MNVDLTMLENELSMETIDEITGYDGISTSQTGKFDDSLYPALKERGIKQIAQRSAGCDMIDLDEASTNDLIVSNVPSYSPDAIAEYAVFAALNIIRNTNVIESDLKQQNYTWNKKILSREIRSMTVVIIGTGRIGKIAAQIFKDFRGKEIDDTILLELMERYDVLLSPHNAFYVDTAVMNLVEGGLNSAYQLLTTGTCDNRVN